MQQKSATTKIKGGIMKTLSNPLLKFDTYIDIKTAMSQQAYPIVLNGCVDSQKAHFIPNLGEDFPCRFVLTYKEEKAKELYQDLSFLIRIRCCILREMCCFTVQMCIVITLSGSEWTF